MKADDRYDSLFAYYWWSIMPAVAAADWTVTAAVTAADWTRAKAVALVESSMNPRAASGAGARGLMQLTAIAVEDFGLSWASIDPYNPETSIQLGIRYLIERCWLPTADETADSATRWALAHAAYNAGPTRVRTVWRERDRPSLEDEPCWAAFLSGIPDETRDYLDRIEYARARL